MKWESRDSLHECVISSSVVAWVSPNKRTWEAGVDTCGNEPVEYIGEFRTIDAAKSAVAAWIGKTIAQLGNALAAGEPRVDEE